MKLFTVEQISDHASTQSCWVYDERGYVYDVTNFLSDHPGGAELVLEYAGKNVSHILRDEASHLHSDAAYEILNEFVIGRLVPAVDRTDEVVQIDELAIPGPAMTATENGDVHVPVFKHITELNISEEDRHRMTDVSEDFQKNKFLDLSRPLLMQVFWGNFSKEFYLDQVHRPRHYAGGSAPLFGNFLEPLSLTPWYVVPTVWLPCVCYGVSVALQVLSPRTVAMLFAIGLCIWTLVEYIMHRFLFHLDSYLPDNRVFITMHFLFHGVHHYLPMDRMRLVMPPTLFLAFAYPWWCLATALFPYYYALSIYCGGIMGYIMYDCTHYFLHHKRLYLEHLVTMKSYHMDHHYRNYDQGFGVTSKFWDGVFNTLLLEEQPGFLAKLDGKSS